MKIKSAIFLFIACLSFTVAGNAMEKPQQPQVAGKQFWLIKKMIVDVDKMLDESGIPADSCIYHSYQSKKDLAYNGLGPCLYYNFKDSMNTNDLSGVTYFWLNGAERDSQPIEIHWRPPVGGLKKTVYQAFEMKFEEPLYWLRTKVKIFGDAEEIGYDQFLLGSIDIIFPANMTAESLVKGQGVVSNILRSFLSETNTVSLQASPVYRKDGLVFHSGKIIAQLATSEKNAEPKVITFTTNLNIASKYREATFDLTNTADGLLYAP